MNIKKSALIFEDSVGICTNISIQLARCIQFNFQPLDIIDDHVVEMAGQPKKGAPTDGWATYLFIER